VELDNKFYELRIASPKRGKNMIRLNKIWVGPYKLRLHFSRRSYNASFSFLKSPTYISERNNRILKIETFSIEVDDFRYISNIVFYLEKGFILSLSRSELMGRIVNFGIHPQDYFSTSSIESDAELCERLEI
jgi:hypothetical protein